MNESPQVSSHRILVVDDNPSIHEDFRKILCPKRLASGAEAARLAAEFFDEAPKDRALPAFEMDSAFQGQEALEKIQQAEQAGRPYSLAFVDVRMPPGWDGIETICRIWKDYPHIQVVICTAYSDYSWEEMLQKLGETDSLVILKKPFDNVEVLQLAHTLTKKWSLTRQANTRMAELDEIVDSVLQSCRRPMFICKEESNGGRWSKERCGNLKSASIRPSRRCRLPWRFGHWTPGFTWMLISRSSASAVSPGRNCSAGPPEELGLPAVPDQHAQLLRSLRSGQTVRNAPLEIRRKDGQLRQYGCLCRTAAAGRTGLPAGRLAGCDRAATARGPASPGAEDGGHRPTRRRCRPRFQQPADRHSRVRQPPVGQERPRCRRGQGLYAGQARLRASCELTRQLLAFSRKQVVQRKPLDVAATVTRMQAMLTRVLGETIQLECRNAPALPTVNADEANIEQVIMNLSVNARDAMGSGGKLSLATEAVTITADRAAGHPESAKGLRRS